VSAELLAMRCFFTGLAFGTIAGAYWLVLRNIPEPENAYLRQWGQNMAVIGKIGCIGAYGMALLGGLVWMVAVLT
jgi:hypothetical protein